MIKYLGSKRALLGLITETIAQATPGGSVLDLFSGTSRVGHALKKRGYRVIANDHNAYAHVLAQCYVAADLDDLRVPAESLVKEFNTLRGVPGYFTETFCEKSRFFQPKNGARVDAIREAIVRKSLPPDLEAVMLVSLMEAADRVDSTTGVQMAYLKGVPHRRVVWQHIIPNALIPTINAIALTVAWLIGGVVVVETVFNFPGLGRLLTSAVSDRDLPLVQALGLVGAFFYIGTNMIADLMTLWLTPRLRTQYWQNAHEN